MKKSAKPMTEKEAIKYLKKVLKWEAFIQSHKKIKYAIECLIYKDTKSE